MESLKRTAVPAVLGILFLFMLAGIQYGSAHARMSTNYETLTELISPHFTLLHGEAGDSWEIMERWKFQYFLLLGISAFLFCTAYMTREGILSTTAVIFQGMLYCISLYADVFWLTSQLTFCIALAAGAHLLFPALPAALLSAVYSVLLIFFPRVPTAWYFIPPEFPLDTAVGYAATASAVSLLLYLVHHTLDTLNKERALISYLRKSVIQLTSANVNFQDYAASAEERSSRNERNRITREVHDTTGHTLTNLVMMLEAAKDLVKSSPEKMIDHLSSAREQAQYALAEIRKTLRILRQDDVQNQDGRAMLHRIFKTFELATNVKVRVEYRNIVFAPRYLIDATVLRIIQESLTNAFRHGNATEVKVLFWYDRGLSIVISDNGRGTGSITEGIGLQSMREQLLEVGGNVKTQSVKGKGFEVQVWIPYRENG